MAKVRTGSLSTETTRIYEIVCEEKKKGYSFVKLWPITSVGQLQRNVQLVIRKIYW